MPRPLAGTKPSTVVVTMKQVRISNSTKGKQLTISAREFFVIYASLSVDDYKILLKLPVF
jgi:hypothetical protein